MVFSKSLTTKEVARLCRVSDATVKRWEDAGLLQSERTSGGHRRFRAAEIARFQRQQNLGNKITLGGETIAKSLCRLDADRFSDSSFLQMLIAGSEEEASNFLISAHLYGKSVTNIFDRVICAAMHRIGELWCKGELTVAQEHLATRTAHNAASKLRQILPAPEPNGLLALCCGVEGDFHELPTYLAQITLENSGWETINFGANMPFFALAEEVLRCSPDVICLSASIILDIERLVRDYKNFRERLGKHKIPIIVGGRAFNDEEVRRRVLADFYAESYTDASEFLQTLFAKNSL